MMAKEEEIRRSREHIVRRVNAYDKALQLLINYGATAEAQVFVDIRTRNGTEDRLDLSELYCPDIEVLKANVTMQLQKLKNDLKELLK